MLFTDLIIFLVVLYCIFRLPEVPSLSEVPFITTNFTDDLFKEIQSLVDSDGRVYERAPVQITEVEERPGALLVKWEEVSHCAGERICCH